MIWSPFLAQQTVPTRLPRCVISSDGDRRRRRHTTRGQPAEQLRRFRGSHPVHAEERDTTGPTRPSSDRPRRPARAEEGATRGVLSRKQGQPASAERTSRRRVQRTVSRRGVGPCRPQHTHKRLKPSDSESVFETAPAPGVPRMMGEKSATSARVACDPSSVRAWCVRCRAPRPAGRSKPDTMPPIPATDPAVLGLAAPPTGLVLGVRAAAGLVVGPATACRPTPIGLAASPPGSSGRACRTGSGRAPTPPATASGMPPGLAPAPNSAPNHRSTPRPAAPHTTGRSFPRRRTANPAPSRATSHGSGVSGPGSAAAAPRDSPPNIPRGGRHAAADPTATGRPRGSESFAQQRLSNSGPQLAEDGGADRGATGKLLQRRGDETPAAEAQRRALRPAPGQADSEC